MVTGNNLTAPVPATSEFFDLTYSDEPASNYILLLEIASKSVKASWYHKSKNLITGFAKYPIEIGSATNGIESLLKSYPFLGSDFAQTIISLFTHNCQIFPLGVGIKTGEEIFSLTNELNAESDQLLNHELVSGQTILQYTASRKLVVEINRCFSKSLLIPHLAPRIEDGLIRLKKSILTNQLSAHIEDDHITIIAFENRQLILSNSFYQTGKEDVAYYILYVAEVLGFDSEKTNLHLSGQIKIGDDKWNILSAYWKRIKIAEALLGIDLSGQIHSRPQGEFDYLTQQLLCA